MLSNRELATAAWILGLLAFAGRSADVRASLRGVVRAFCRPKILGPFVLLALYTVGLVAVLRTVGVWTPELVKDTVFWFVFTAAATSLSLVTSYKGGGVLRPIAADALKVAVLVEFLTGNYTFSLPTELVLVPVLGILGGMAGLADARDEYAVVRPVLRWMLLGAGLLLFAGAVRGAVADYQHLGTLATLRAVVIAPLLSLLFAPFAYLLLVWVTYENLFIRLRVGAEKPPALARYARRRLARCFGLRLSRLHAFSAGRGRELAWVRSRQEFDALLRAAPLNSVGP